MQNNQLIILISGKQGSGKSTLAAGLTEFLGTIYYIVTYKFAQPLYTIHDLINNYMSTLGFHPPVKDGTLLQVLGTDWGRTVYGSNVWVDALKNRITKESAEIIIIDDLRFPEELLAFKQSNAISIRLEAPEALRKVRAEGWRDATDHPSETALDSHISSFDLLINSADISKQDILHLSLKTIVPKLPKPTGLTHYGTTTYTADGSDIVWHEHLGRS